MTRYLKVKPGDSFKVGTLFYLNGYRSMPGGWPRSTLFVGPEESRLEVPWLIRRSVGMKGKCLNFSTSCLLNTWTNKGLLFLDSYVFVSVYADLPDEVLTGVKLLLPRWSSLLFTERDFSKLFLKPHGKAVQIRQTSQAMEGDVDT